MGNRETNEKTQKVHPDTAQRYKRDFWAMENPKFAEHHYRLNKAGRIVRKLVDGRECDLLDLGCGPGTFAELLPENVHYYGIDIAVQKAAPNLIEMDLLETPIGFRDMKFDLVLAQGILEYLGDRQAQKFAEIRSILKPGGRFIVTYMNFAHRSSNMYHAHSNVQHLKGFRRDLERYFVIDRSFPGAYNWNHTLPSRKIMKRIQTPLEVNIPIIGPILAVDYFHICSPLPAEGD